ncbi:MAG: hypothetical protein LBU70_05445 [Chitinispirillales bacterium]|jgi:predicted RNA-binding Zn-ribbon protein involved in translation (DUF1610 family)|nr:hypothetical protein [Chitinispirillales bacterium]
MATIKKTSFVCPNCGEQAPGNARACPTCGSDEQTGWSESTYLDGIDLPFEDDDYEEIRAKEFGGTEKERVGIFSDINWKMVIGIMVVSSMIASILIRGC